jgi:hypothetical protein
MRTRLYLLTAVITVVALLTGVSTGGTSNDRDDGTLRLLLRTQTVTPVDIGQPGNITGNPAVLTGEVMRQGRVVGRFYVHCIGLTGTPTEGAADCTTTIVLPRGRLITQSEVTLRGTATREVGAIIGGTGIYRTADGDATAEASDFTEEIETVLRIER